MSLYFGTFHFATEYGGKRNIVTADSIDKGAGARFSTTLFSVNQLIQMIQLTLPIETVRKLAFPLFLACCLAKPDVVWSQGLPRSQSSPTREQAHKASDVAVQPEKQRTSSAPGKAPASQYDDLLQQAKMLARHRNYRSAYILCTRAINLDAQQPKAYIARGKIFARAKNPERAIKDFDSAIALQPSPEAYLERGSAYSDLDSYGKAEADLSAAIRLSPTAEAYSERGHVFKHARDYHRAIGDFSRTIAIDPNDADSYELRADCYFYLADYARAEADYTKAIQIDPHNSSHYYERGMFYRLQAAEPQKALQDFQKVMEIDRSAGDDGLYFQQGGCYVMLGKWHDALLTYTRSMAKTRTFNDYKNRGRVFVLLGDYDKAITDFTAALAIDHGNSMMYVLRGRVFQRLGREAEAATDFKQAMLLDAGLAESYYSNDVQAAVSKQRLLKGNSASFADIDRLLEKAQSLEARKDYQGALEIYNQTYNKFPDQYELLLMRGRVFSKLGRFDEAIRDFSDAYTEDSVTTAEAIRLRANAFCSKRCYKNALADLNKLVWLDPFSPQSYFDKAVLLERLGRTREALLCYKECVNCVANDNTTLGSRLPKYKISQQLLQEAAAKAALLQERGFSGK